MTTGRRFGGVDAQAYAIVDGTAGEGAVDGAALDILRPLAGKDPARSGRSSRPCSVLPPKSCGPAGSPVGRGRNGIPVTVAAAAPPGKD